MLIVCSPCFSSFSPLSLAWLASLLSSVVSRASKLASRVPYLESSSTSTPFLPQ